jgi:ABC-type multidrug transport system ATPase subunit
LLDETTSQLDAEQSRLAEGRVRAFADAGASVIWVSHEPALAERIGARNVLFPRCLP